MPSQFRRFTRGVDLPSQVHRHAGAWRVFAAVDLMYVKLVDELIRFGHPARVAHVNAGAILAELFAKGTNPSPETILRRTKGIVIRFTHADAAVPSIPLHGLAFDLFQSQP